MERVLYVSSFVCFWRSEADFTRGPAAALLSALTAVS